jgi:integrase
MAEGSVKLTQALVRSIAYERADGQPQFIWDTEHVGLGVRLTAGGARSFVLRYRVNGKQRLKTLGKTTTHSVDDARIWARDGLSSADKGQDFQAVEERERALGTVGQLWSRYLNEHVKVHGADRSAKDLASLWRTHLEKPFSAKRLTALATTDVRAWHRRATEPRTITVKLKTGTEVQMSVGGAYAANRALQALKAAINWQIDTGTMPGDFRNPCLGVQLNAEKVRDVILRPEELPKLAKAIDAHPDVHARAFVWLALYTGARRNEILKLEWQHVDLAGKRVTFIDTKNKADRTVPLAAEALRILKALPRVEDNQYVFPGRWKGHRVNVKDPWQEIREAAGLPHLHLHDVRRSVGSWLGAAGHTAPMIGELLGHKSAITSKVYIKLGALDVKKALVGAHAALVKGALKPKTPRRRRKAA